MNFVNVIEQLLTKKIIDVLMGCYQRELLNLEPYHVSVKAGNLQKVSSGKKETIGTFKNISGYGSCATCNRNLCPDK